MHVDDINTHRNGQALETVHRTRVYKNNQSLVSVGLTFSFAISVIGAMILVIIL